MLDESRADAGFFFGRTLGEDDFEDQEGCSDDDRAVGYVKRWPLVATDVEEQEVCDVSRRQAIP